MKTRLATHNLMHHRMRTLAAAAGVMLSVVLIFMQLGFLGSVEATASLVYDALEFDLIVRSSDYLPVSVPGAFPRERLQQVASHPDVTAARAVHLALLPWHHPTQATKRRVFAIAVDPLDCPFSVAEIRDKASLLVQSGAILVDRKSRPEFGPHNGRQFGDDDLGREVEVAGERVRIAGHFELASCCRANQSSTN
jgi:putative ABC transport system permease protein